MEFFGISSAKIILILVIAIVLLGPDQVPQMVKTVGKFIRDFRRWTNEMNKEFNEATGDLRKEFNDTVSGLRDEIEQTQTDLRSQLNPLTDVLRDPLGTTTSAAESVPVSAVGVPSFATAEAVAALTNDANPLAMQTPAYTPPEPVAFTAPEPALSPNGVPLGFDGTNGGYTNGAADGVANGTYTNGVTNDTNGGVFPDRPRATKADPFADLVALAPPPVSAPAITTVTSEPVADFAAFDPPAPLEPIPAVAMAATDAATDTAPEPTPEPVAALAAVPSAPRPISVGRSVSGTRYGRKRAS